MNAGQPSGAAALTGDFLLLGALLVLPACGGLAPSTGEPEAVVNAEPDASLVRPPPAPTMAAADSAFEQRTRQQAEELMQAARWMNAAARWEILTLLRPEYAEYAGKLNEARSRAANQASERLVPAAEARKRGDLPRAATLYLNALSADPYNATAAQVLRELEREQSHRAYFSHAPGAAGGTSGTRAIRAPYSADRQELDTGVMLLHQGDYSASVQALQSYLKRYPQDDVGKRTLREAYAALGKQRIELGKKEEGLGYLEKARTTKSNGGADLDSTVQTARKDLAQDYYEQGLRLQRTDLDAAIRLWERSLQYDPGHAQARLRLDQARRMQRNLQTIPGASSKP